jgi:N-acetylmuramoyl-L-alanine amidase
VLHESSTPNAPATNEQAYFDSGYRAASAHAFVDTSSIIQCIPWNEQSWHAGPTADSNYIGIELCHYDDSRFNQVYNNAVELFAWLYANVLHKTVVTKENLMSHAEVSNKWGETDHDDPISYFSQHGKSVNGFRSDVQAALNILLKPKEVYTMKKVVLCYGDADLFAGVMVAQKNKCAVMLKDDYVASGEKAETIIEVGGHSPSRFESFKQDASLL